MEKLVSTFAIINQVFMFKIFKRKQLHVSTQRNLSNMYGNLTITISGRTWLSLLGITLTFKVVPLKKKM